MSLLETLRIALSNLSRHRLQTLLTMLGMIFGVAAVLAMLSIGAGAERRALELIEGMGLHNVVIKAREFEEEELKAVRQDSPGMSRRDLDALRQALPEQTVLVGRKKLKAYQVFSRWGHADSDVFGVSALLPQVSRLRLVEGAFFLPLEDRLGRPVCVLGEAVSRKLFGLNPALGERIAINHEWFTVVGVVGEEELSDSEFEGIELESNNNTIFMPLGTLLSRFDTQPLDDELDEITARLPAEMELDEGAALISSLMVGMHNRIDDFTLVVPQRLLQQSRQTQRIFNVVMGTIASISLLVGGIGIMNIMLAAVLERTREIGLRRAVGARRRDIGRQFVLEAVTISFSGAVAGIGLGYGIARLVSGYSGWPTTVTPFAVVLGVGVSVSVGLISGVYPARRASTVSPIEALRYE